MKKNNKYPQPVKVNYDESWKFSFTVSNEEFDFDEWLSETNWLRPNTNYHISYCCNSTSTMCTIEYRKPTLFDNLKNWFWR